MSETSQNEKDYPKFATKLEEDAYWAGRHAEIEARALAAFANGKVTRGRAARQIEEHRAKRAAEQEAVSVQQKPHSIDLDPEDFSQAQMLADKKGLRYQTYLRILIHEALQREAQAAGSTQRGE